METKEFLPNYSDGSCERSEKTSFIPFDGKELVVVQIGEGCIEDHTTGRCFDCGPFIMIPGFKMSEPHPSTFCPHPGAIDVLPVPLELHAQIEVELEKQFTEPILFW